METALSYVVAASIFAMLVLGINAVYSKVSYPLAGVVAAIGMHIGLSLFAGNTENITALETLPFAIKNFSAVAFLVSGVASPPPPDCFARGMPMPFANSKLRTLRRRHCYRAISGSPSQ